MTNMFTRVRWGWVALVAAAAYATSYLLGTILISGYGLALGWRAPATDAAVVTDFAAHWSGWLGRGALFLFTGAGAYWVARKAGAEHLAHGLLVGLTVAGIHLLTAARAGWITGLTILLVLLAGWLGGRAGRRADRRITRRTA